MRQPVKHTTKSGQTSWRVRFRRIENGKPRETSETFDTHREAVSFAKLVDAIGADAALQHLYEREPIIGAPTLNEYAERHIESITRITDGTRARYRGIWSRVWAEPIGDLPIDALDRHAIAKVVNAMSRAGAADKTIANAHGLLAGIMKGAVLDGYIETSPCIGVKLPRATDHETETGRYLTQAEFVELSLHVREVEPSFEIVAWFLAGTGCRWGELEALDRQALDLDAGTVKIRRAAKYANVTPRPIGPTKTKRSKRTIALPDELIEALRVHTARMKPDALVFTDLRGRQLSQAVFWRVWDKARKAADLESVRIHDLRHSHASWLLAAGVPVHVVSARLGHESIQTTVDTYGHLMPDMQTAAARAAGLVFNGVKMIGSSG